jgi:two-component system sensor histidine kinase YesM
MLPLLTFIIYYNFYAIKVVHNQVADSYKNMMSFYMRDMDNNLQNVDEYLINLYINNYELQIMEHSTNKNDFDYSKIQLVNKISKDIFMYKAINSIYIYSISRDYYMNVISDTVPYEEQMAVQEHITTKCRELKDSKENLVENWYVKKLNQDYYMFRFLKIGDIYIGAWVNVKKLLIPLDKIELGQNGTSLLATELGEPMMNEQFIFDNKLDLNKDFSKHYIMGDNDKYLVVGERSSKGNMSLIAAIPDNEILEKLPYLQRGIAFFSLALIVLLPIALILLRKIILVPLKRMAYAMKRIKEGDLETRIKPYKTSEEFEIVNENFNNMMEQIHQLKIDVYEENINRQKAELKHLQLQINPHFFLNSLNIIHTLARGKNYELIQEMTLCLIQYFRYMFRSNMTFVSLKEELQHVRNYVRIQELRFPKSLSCSIEAPEFLLDMPVPPLIVHTFIENSIKYAVTLDEPVLLTVDIEIVDNREIEPCFKITISDTGKGFKEEILEKLRSSRQIIDERGEHIGIWNVQRRLELLYKGRGKILFRNGKPEGAVIEIVLPMNVDNLDLEE